MSSASVVSGRIDTFYKNTSGSYISIAKIPIGQPNAKIVSGRVYVYYYRSPDERYTTLGSIPVSGVVIVPPPPCPAGQHRDASGNCVPDTPPPPPPTNQLGPYPSTGKELGATTRRAVRHYASGKPDDQTIEKNTKDIPYQNYQCIYYVKMHKIEHDDNISSKLGGTHMGSGWYDHGVSFQEGQTCLGYEPDHPTTHSCVKKGVKIGSIIEKRTGVATVYRKQTDHTELWTNTGSGWVKQLESNGLDGWSPNNSDNDEAQLRIDGFTDGSDPSIDVAVVQEIA